LAVAILWASCTGCVTQEVSSAPTEQATGGDLVTVKTLSPERKALQRTTTQPATVHAYHQAEIYAKVVGYLEKLNADIGQRVTAGSVLGVIAMPEMVKSRERQEATVRRLQADEKRAEAQIVVAQANAESAAALLEQARADVAGADARLKADRIEHDRVSDLVQDKAVAGRLGDESLQRYESAQAAKLSLEAAVASAAANLNVAAANRKAAEADLDAAKARTEVAIKELEELDVLMAYATLRAPFDGTVTGRHADPGDLIRNAPASSGSDSPPLFVISQTDKVRVQVPVPERHAVWVDVGDPATISFPALPGTSFSGKVNRVAGQLDDSTRSMTVEIDLENSAGRLLPGMFGEATIVLDEQRDALVLPAGAVRHDETGKCYVYVVDSADKVRVVEVTVGLDDGNTIQITNGLSGNERVVDAMLGRLQPDQAVRAQN
jgi:RND family efflux transporter MFP subunit